ncbi:MAG: portal protein, partial [Sphingomonadales bacterium]
MQDRNAAHDAEDVLREAHEAFERVREWWSDNHAEAKDDLAFARLGQQWDERIRRQRELEHRPCLTFNKMPAFIRQVVNDARQNRPAIKVHPQDARADVRTAEIINGLIRNIETSSDADVAYDTAIEHAVGQGFGYWRINTRYTSDDAFDQDIVIERIANPFTVYGDPRSTAADSSDWNEAFVVTTMTRAEFEAAYPDAKKTDWEADFRTADGWIDGDTVTVAEYWTREKAKSAIVALSDGSVLGLDEYREKAGELAGLGLTMVGEPRDVESHKVVQRILSGAEILKEVAWAGNYIPIIPVYGDEVVDEDGKRHFRSLIRDAKSAQQMFNYWRTTTTELVALAPKAPFIGEERAFELDPNWNTANSQSHPYLMVPTGAAIPQRQPFTGVPAGAMQEALNASDDMKAIIGVYDASLGARSNETSGRAILARQREGDVSTFHFIDNLSRAIRHGGRVLLDLIPKVYTTQRMVRVLGNDLKPQTVAIAPTGEPVSEQTDEAGAVIGHVYDISAGKYDLTVAAGPSYTTRREEVTAILTDVMRSVPDSAVFLAGRLARLLDLPDAEELGREMDMLNPARRQAANAGAPGDGGQQIA